MNDSEQQTHDDYQDQLKAIGAAIDGVLNQGMAPKEIGFALLMFRFGENPGGSLNYVSNAQRADMLCALKEMVARFEGRAADVETPQ